MNFIQNQYYVNSVEPKKQTTKLNISIDKWHSIMWQWPQSKAPSASVLETLCILTVTTDFKYTYSNNRF